MKVMSIFGTRPEMIKMWGTLKKLDDLNFEHIMVHTGQNFTPELKDFFFRDLNLRLKANYEGEPPGVLVDPTIVYDGPVPPPPGG